MWWTSHQTTGALRCALHATRDVLEGHPTCTLFSQPVSGVQQTRGRYTGTALVACWHGWIFMDAARLRSVTSSMACSMLRSRTSHPRLIVMHQPCCDAEALLLRMLYMYMYV